MQDVAVLLVVSGSDASPLTDSIAVLRAGRPDLPVVVLADEDRREEIGAGAHRVLDVPVIGVGRRPADRGSFDWRLVRGAVAARTVVAVALPAADGEDAQRALAAAFADPPDGERGDPVLLPLPGTPRWVIASYVREVLRTPTAQPGTVAHAGRLAMGAARLTAEAVDPRDHQIRVTARVSMPHGLQQPPPWRFQVGVRRPGGDPAWSAPTALRRRTDWAGQGQWERLVADVPMDRLPTGTYELLIQLVDDAPGPPRPLRPSIGSVAPGRVRTTVRAPGRTQDGPGGRTRYLPFTTGPHRTRLVVQQDADGRAAARAWWRRRWLQDARFVVRGRAPWQPRLLLLTRMLTRPLFRGELWLVGERRETAQDNGLHLFRFLRRTQPRRRVYYVLDRDSPQYATTRRWGRVVAHSSWRHQLLMLHADVLANAFSMPYMIPRSWDQAAYHTRLAWRIGALRVFLQHGVHISPAALQRMTTGYDLVLTSAAEETRSLREVSGYDEQLVETGLPRYDALAPGESSRTVVFLTTWRRYLPSRIFAGQDRRTDPFTGSAYERFTTALLHSDRLQQVLERHDYRMVFLPHHNLADQFRHVRPAGDRVAVVEATGEAIQRLVRSCDVFLTDHSSVHFDAAYVGKPVIYARFDKEEYESRHAAPSWFDFQGAGFGPVTTTLEETLTELDRVLETGCRQDPVYRDRVRRLFTHRDQRNAHRVVEAIEARLAQRADDLR